MEKHSLEVVGGRAPLTLYSRHSATCHLSYDFNDKNGMSPLFDATCVREQWLIAKETRFWFKIILKMLGKNLC